MGEITSDTMRYGLIARSWAARASATETQGLGDCGSVTLHLENMCPSGQNSGQKSASEGFKPAPQDVSTENQGKGF